MEEESVGVTYNKLVVSKVGDFIVHMLHMVYFPKTNENRSSENVMDMKYINDNQTENFVIWKSSLKLIGICKSANLILAVIF